MTKGIAIQTILLLLVGILVVGIVVYMVYRYFVGAPLGEHECRARMISWCNTCRINDFTEDGFQLGPDLGGADGCIDKYNWGSNFEIQCLCNGNPAVCPKDADDMRNLCQAFTGQS